VFILLSVIIAGVWLTGSELAAKDRQLIQKVGETTVLNLEKQTLFAENIVATIAALAISSRDIDSLKMQLEYQVKALANNPAIVSVGVWPKPFSFDPSRKKSSLFWLRSDDNTFTFTDKYNDPQVADYFLQEWYLPAKFIQNDGCYWSRSYTDIISKEPMVTCAKSLVIDGVFQGVTSIDISLRGLKSNLQNIMKNTQGYALVLDRNNTFIATPSLKYQKEILGITQQPVTFKKTLEDQLRIDKRFIPLKTILDENFSEIPHPQNPNLSEYLNQTASDISITESINIVSSLYDTKQQLHSKQLTMEHDPLFEESVEIVYLHMPKTDWVVVLAFPKRLVLAKAKVVSFQLFLIMAIAILLGAFFLSYTLRRILIKPLRSMINTLRDRPNEEIPLIGNNDEISELAQVYNNKQQALNKSSKVLLEAKQRYQSILDTAIEGIITLDINFRIIDANPAALLLLTQSKDNLRFQSFTNMLDEPSKAVFEDWISKQSSSEAKQQELVLIIKKGNRKINIECSASHSKTDEQQFLTLFIRDITRRKANERNLKKLATKDSLTGLANRNTFNQQLSQSIQLADRQSSRVALLFIDLDLFKSINDNYGHNAGDKLLVLVAKRIARDRRSTDVVARLGGDEFAVILHDIESLEVICTIASEIINSLKATYKIENTQCQIGASIGIATYPENAKNATELVKKADAAMYKAKQAGRNQWKLSHTQSEHLQQLLNFSE
jgi:diguanylate cyclase (GGDEF)-like protein/PAS domain S-box-containing protein